jgi:hypothetical protein
LLNHGSNIKAAHLNYWANHPKAVCVLEKFRDELDRFMESESEEIFALKIFSSFIQWKPLNVITLGHLEKDMKKQYGICISG